jgi:hypothetical protein
VRDSDISLFIEFNFFKTTHKYFVAKLFTLRKRAKEKLAAGFSEY